MQNAPDHDALMLDYAATRAALQVLMAAITLHDRRDGLGAYLGSRVADGFLPAFRCGCEVLTETGPRFSAFERYAGVRD